MVEELFNKILEDLTLVCRINHASLTILGAKGYTKELTLDTYSVIRSNIIDMLAELGMGYVPDWNEINAIKPKLEL